MKYLILAILTTVTLTTFFCFSALACDPNENCRECAIHNPWGGCIEYWNNPSCELRKKDCQMHITSCITSVSAAAVASPVCYACIVSIASGIQVDFNTCATACGTTVAALDKALKECKQ